MADDERDARRRHTRDPHPDEKRRHRARAGRRPSSVDPRQPEDRAVQVDGKDLYLGVNAYVYAEPKATR